MDACPSTTHLDRVLDNELVGVLANKHKVRVGRTVGILLLVILLCNNILDINKPLEKEKEKEKEKKKGKKKKKKGKKKSASNREAQR